MKSTRAFGSRQPDLLPRARCASIPVAANHRLVQIADTLDWTEMEESAQQIRAQKLKNGAGRPPRLRVLLGAMILMATRRMTYRDAEDQIRYYAPARYLCGLTESEWTPDFTTIQDFTELMGEDGIQLINQHQVVGKAVEHKLADPTTVVADTTAQEAQIPHPNEMGLMAAFLTSVGAASKKVGRALKGFADETLAQFKKAKEKVREYRLFAKAKATKNRMMKEMAAVVEKVNRCLGKALASAAVQGARIKKHAIVAKGKLLRLHQAMTTLIPQIRYWLRTGFVASGKLISLHTPELYSVVRGKVGKKVEFGLNWGIARLRGGYLLGTVASDRRELQDSKFAVKAVENHIALFGKAPDAYAYDRAGYSAANVDKLKKLGVKHVGLAPRGRSEWEVSGAMKKKLYKERALVEGGIGTIKAPRYGFNRPSARSAKMMGACGQRAIMGFNINKLIRELAARNEIAVVG